GTGGVRGAPGPAPGRAEAEAGAKTRKRAPGGGPATRLAAVTSLTSGPPKVTFPESLTKTRSYEPPRNGKEKPSETSKVSGHPSGLHTPSGSRPSRKSVSIHPPTPRLTANPPGAGVKGRLRSARSTCSKRRTPKTSTIDPASSDSGRSLVQSTRCCGRAAPPEVTPTTTVPVGGIAAGYVTSTRPSAWSTACAVIGPGLGK